MFESRAEIENVEMEALRHQIIDLQTQTDEKVICIFVVLRIFPKMKKFINIHVVFDMYFFNLLEFE